MNAVVSLRTFADPSSVSIVVFADIQQGHIAARTSAVSRIDRAPNGALCRNQEFTDLCDASAGQAPAYGVARAVSKVSGLYGGAYETDDWFASTLPRKLGIGKNAGG